MTLEPDLDQSKYQQSQGATRVFTIVPGHANPSRSRASCWCYERRKVGLYNPYIVYECMSRACAACETPTNNPIPSCTVYHPGRYKYLEKVRITAKRRKSEKKAPGCSSRNEGPG
jgi:hypothetical protein